MNASEIKQRALFKGETCSYFFSFYASLNCKIPHSFLGCGVPSTDLQVSKAINMTIEVSKAMIPNPM